MKKYIYSALLVFATTFSLVGCKDGAFGGDEVPGGVELQDMCGTWVCTAEANDPWFTMLNYAEDYTPEFINGYFGDPFGNYNPDTNGDGIVDMQDIAKYTEDDLWYDENDGETFEFTTANSAANNTTEMVVAGELLIKNKYKSFTFKVNVNHGAKEFSVGEIKNSPYNIVSITPATINNTYDNNGKPVVLGGKILPLAATAPGSGMKRDSIVFYMKCPGDFGEDIYYKVSGYRKTGYTED